MTEKELIRKTENKLKMYELMKINYNNITDDILKLETKKDSPSSAILSDMPRARRGDTGDFRLLKVIELINKKKSLQSRLEAEIMEIERSIKSIKDDRYFFIIEEYYIKNNTIQSIISNHFISRVTFFNHRNRLLKKLGFVLYPEVFVEFSINYI